MRLEATARAFWLGPDWLQTEVLIRNAVGLIPPAGFAPRRMLAGRMPALPPERASPVVDEGSIRFWYGNQKTNMPTPAPNMKIVVMATMTRLSMELGWLHISLRSEATRRMAIRMNGASRPLMTAVQ